MTLISEAFEPHGKKDKKKKKQQRRLEEMQRAEAEHRAALEAAGPDAPALEAPSRPEPKRGFQKRLEPIERALDAHLALTATKSSVLIAVNCLMLSVAAHVVFSEPPEGALWGALVPLALTNLLSLAFAIFSARAPEVPTPLDALCEKPDGEYQQLLESKEQVNAALAHELHEQSAALTRARKHLRTAYQVLLSGVVLTAVTFAVCLALGSGR